MVLLVRDDATGWRGGMGGGSEAVVKLRQAYHSSAMKSGEEHKDHAWWDASERSFPLFAPAQASDFSFVLMSHSFV